MVGQVVGQCWDDDGAGGGTMVGQWWCRWWDDDGAGGGAGGGTMMGQMVGRWWDRWWDDGGADGPQTQQIKAVCVLMTGLL